MERQSSGREPRIVVVYDEPRLLACIEAILREENYRVFASLSADEALPHLRAHGADLVLVNKRKPPMDGFEVVEWLRADRSLAHIPVILFASADQELRANQLGVFDCICQPVGRAELLERVFRAVCVSVMSVASWNKSPGV